MSVDQFLACSLRNEHCPWWELERVGISTLAAFDRILYHGISGLLVDTARVNHWPPALSQQIEVQARAQAMWELRHREVLEDLTARLSALAVRHALMKGTALAYRCYEQPSQRSRGDTDLLVPAEEVKTVRALLAQSGFQLLSTDQADHQETLQESWELSHLGGTRHVIDLHWQVLNSMALRELLSVEECLANAVPLPSLCEHARSMDLRRTLIHTCLHMAMNRTVPYFFGDSFELGGRRMIWAVDIQRIARTFSENDWDDFAAIASRFGVAEVCLAGLEFSKEIVALDYPATICQRLSQSSKSSPEAVFLMSSGRRKRLWANINAAQGFSPKFRLARQAMFARPAELRARFPRYAHLPVPVLHLIRWWDFLFSGART